ncbi:hypothetical protein EC973_001556 [Apophysomyces ossiformis]|uniref:Uncharacterized protein n=1 Tax=Apophysomyces ossiformis TaxID=679940 RepID=A0A8H7EMA6_9FUNG|nr:hypothetical protein EC973_001556 [Apophysomyces ossiformis]
MNDVVEFVEHFLAQTSTSLQSLFGISYRKRQSCSCTPSLERLEDLNYRTIQYVNPYHFKDRNQNDDTLGEKFSNWFIENFENSKKRKCHACNSIAIKHLEVVDLPQFLIFCDQSNYVRRAKNFKFPPRFALGDTTYELRATIRSTHETGIHFYANAVIKTTTPPFVSKIDNMREEVEVLIHPYATHYDYLCEENRYNILLFYAKL